MACVIFGTFQNSRQKQRLLAVQPPQPSKPNSAVAVPQNIYRAGRKLLCRGGGGGTEAHFPNPPPPLLGRGDGRGVARPAGPGGGGVNPTSMAQNDTHVALIILTTQMWGGGGGDYWWKKLFRAKICVPAPSAPSSILTQNKGPDTEPHFSNPPPFLRWASICHPPPPPAEQSSGRPAPPLVPYRAPPPRPP